jgi:hypothetical protein
MDKIEQEFDTKDDVQSNIMQNNLEKEKNILETISDSSRVQYVTKRGRNVKMRKDLFENYEFLQRDLLKCSIDQKVKQYPHSMVSKIKLKYFPTEKDMQPYMSLWNYTI